MVMETMQIRMSSKLVELVDSFVKSGIYANRSDVIRDAVRRFVWEREVGSVKSKGSGVELARNARKVLSRNINEL